MLTTLLLALPWTWTQEAPDPNQAPKPATPDRIELRIADDAELDLEAYWEPCRESAYGRFEQCEALREVAPEKEWEIYEASAFRALLPAGPVAVGEVWELDREASLPFLRQFHPGATAKLHHEPSGTGGMHGCLRAVSQTHAEILLRAHAEIVLDDGSFYCPAQFEGRLLLSRATGQVLAFRLHLPSRNSNVDVNIQTEETREQNRKAAAKEPTIVTLPDGSKVQVVIGPSHGMADIGWVPRMELVGGEHPQIAWEQSIDDAAARLLLRRRFYAPIDWLPLDEAVQKARELHKPLHLLTLFGTYDDEAC